MQIGLKNLLLAGAVATGTWHIVFRSCTTIELEPINQKHSNHGKTKALCLD
jgi:hypothetical protein